MPEDPDSLPPLLGPEAEGFDWRFALAIAGTIVVLCLCYVGAVTVIGWLS